MLPVVVVVPAHQLETYPLKFTLVKNDRKILSHIFLYVIYFINHRDKLLYVIVTGTEAAGLILKKTSQINLFK